MAKSFPSGRIVIAGGSGFLGMNLARHLTRGEHPDCEVVILSRRADRKERSPRIRFVEWNARTIDDWMSELDGAAGLVNLNGRTVDCIKTAEHCDQILRSRVEATRVLGQAMGKIDHPPPVWVQMSTAHIYGDPAEDIIIDEDSAFGYGLAPTVGKAWEQVHVDAMANLPGVRSVMLRTSFVIGRSGGALPRLQKLARWGLGGRVGHGRQGMSWLHEADMNRLFSRVLIDDTMHGSYIATAPHPVSQREFMRILRKQLRRPIGLPATAWMVRIGAPLVMRTDPELALYGRYCIPKRLMEEAEFEFEFPMLEDALRDLYAR